MKKKYRTHKDLEKMAENYFAEQEELNKPCSIAGISYFMGFADKSEFLELEKDEEFAPVINRIKLKIESQAIEMLTDKSYATTGVIFNLKCSFGYSDKITAGKDDMAELMQNAKKFIDEAETNE
ncbi:DNA-packaging protein [Mucispirillum schaedleri]|uniref:DNA-packaging protein n=1 Tax=Mucispirillum schaedleri TaxID=248039 RepID=UPI001F5A1DAE|nr:DNA-packaging protein [Mucispirillum schaedleri]